MTKLLFAMTVLLIVYFHINVNPEQTIGLKHLKRLGLSHVKRYINNSKSDIAILLLTSDLW